jgi:hypothetical protein
MKQFRSKALLLLFAGSLLFASCTKNKVTHIAGDASAGYKAVVQKFMAAEQQYGTTPAKQRLRQTSTGIDYTTLRSFSIDPHTQLLMANMLPAGNLLRNQLCRVLFYVTDGEIVTGNLLQSSETADEAIVQYVKTGRGAAGSNYILYSLSQKFLREYSFNADQSVSSKRMIPRHSSDNARTADGCIDWYIVTTVTFSDGSSFQTEQFIGTTCNDCAPNDPDLQSLDCPDSNNNIGAIGLDSLFYTCPQNFTFRAVTTHNLWQEAGISDSYSHLRYYDMQTGQTIIRDVTIELLYFGLPYYDGNGILLHSHYAAANISADALNLGEVDMRRFFRDNPNTSVNDLRQYWIKRADYWMKSMTGGQGKVGKTGSINITNPVAINPYTACQ